LKKINQGNKSNFAGKTSTLAEAIKHHRLNLNMNIDELAKKSGVSAPYTLRLEQSTKKSPTVRTLKKLSEALEIELYEYANSNE